MAGRLPHVTNDKGPRQEEGDGAARDTSGNLGGGQDRSTVILRSEADALVTGRGGWQGVHWLPT